MRTTTLRPWAPAAVAALSGVALLSPWASTGAVTRSGYAFVEAIRSADLAGGLLAAILIWSVTAVPILAAITCAGATMGAGRAAAAVCAVTGAIVLAYSAFVIFAYRARVPLGPWAGCAVGLAALVVSLLRRRDGRFARA